MNSFAEKSWNAVMILLICSLAVYELGLSAHRSINLWDESLYANNSLEMVLNKHYWVYTVNGQVDHFNSKPPLVLWMQALSLKVFGPGEFAVRFPTYLALLGTLALCLFYSKKLTGYLKSGIVACFTLLLAQGMMRDHVFFTGDLDGVLVFFLTALFFHHLKVVQQKTASGKDIYRYSVLLILAYLTKSTAALLVLPSLGVSLVISGQLKNVLLRKESLLAAVLFIGTIALYYVVREYDDPGYWAVVWYSEFTRVAVNIQPWVAYPWNVYFLFLWERFLHLPLVMLAVTGPIYLVLPKAIHKKLLLHSLLMALVYLTVISIPPVKLEWYDAPVYPLIAIALGLALTGLFEVATNKMPSSFPKELLFGILVLGLAIGAFLPFQEQLKQRLAAVESQNEPTDALRQLARRHPETKHFTVLEELLGPKYVHLLDGLFFYQKLLRINRNTVVTIIHNIAETHVGDTILVCKQTKIDSLNNQFSNMLLDTCSSCKWMVLQKKNPQH